MVVCRCLELTRNNKKYTLIAWITGALYTAIMDDKCPTDCSCLINLHAMHIHKKLTRRTKQRTKVNHLHLAIEMIALPEDVCPFHLHMSISASRA